MYFLDEAHGAGRERRRASERCLHCHLPDDGRLALHLLLLCSYPLQGAAIRRFSNHTQDLKQNAMHGYSSNALNAKGLCMLSRTVRHIQTFLQSYLAGPSADPYRSTIGLAAEAFSCLGWN